MEQDVRQVLSDFGLVNGGDCFAHYHSEDRKPTQDFLHGLQTVARQRSVTSDTVLTATDDFILVQGAVTITLPRGVVGSEHTVTNIGTATVTVVPVAGETICGHTSVLMTVQWMSLTFKATNNDWIII